MRGFAPIRYGLLDHLPSMGPYSGVAYLWLHLKADFRGDAAGLVTCTAAQLAAGTGMSRAQAARALRRLVPRYISVVGGGRERLYRIERYVSTRDRSSDRSSLPETDRLYQRQIVSTRDRSSLPETPPAPPIRNKTETETETQAPSVPAGMQTDQSASPESPHAPRSQRPRAPKPRQPDARFGPIRAAIFAAHQAAVGCDPPWDGAEAGQLGRWLRASPTTPIADCLRAVEARYQSERNHAERPAKWLGSLGDYLAGPLDRFGQPLGVRHERKTYGELRSERNARAADEAVRMLEERDRRRAAAAGGGIWPRDLGPGDGGDA